MVVVGGWAPDLLMPDAGRKHIGSIDVDLALDAEKLKDGRYAKLLKLLLDTGRYHRGDKSFQFITNVTLDDGGPPVSVDVEFLAPSDVKILRNRPRLIDDFRVLQFPACAAAFQSPVDTEIIGRMTSGAENRVRLRVASLADLTIMKAHAIGGRDKPKDVYDLCYCLDESPGGIEALSDEWLKRRDNLLAEQAIVILREKFATVNHCGPRQLAIFYDSQDEEEAAIHARRAFELVQKLLSRFSR